MGKWHEQCKSYAYHLNTPASKFELVKVCGEAESAERTSRIAQIAMLSRGSHRFLAAVRCFFKSFNFPNQPLS